MAPHIHIQREIIKKIPQWLEIAQNCRKASKSAEIQSRKNGDWPNYPFNMTDLERQEPVLEFLGHLAQVWHVLVFKFPQTLNLEHKYIVNPQL